MFIFLQSTLRNRFVQNFSRPHFIARGMMMNCIGVDFFKNNNIHLLTFILFKI